MYIGVRDFFLLGDYLSRTWTFNVTGYRSNEIVVV